MLPMRKYRQRIHYTETDKALMWDRWQKGDSLEKIAQLFDRTHSSVARILRVTGGIRPPRRTRSRRVLSLAEREEISRGVVAGRSLRSIAASLNRAPSTVSREINRNGGGRHYRANVAKTPAYRQTRRQRKQVEMLFAHMKRVLKMDRLRLRGIKGAQDEFLLTATAQNLRRMAKYLGTGPPEIPEMA
jgi:IS30 family transposase